MVKSMDSMVMVVKSPTAMDESLKYRPVIQPSVLEYGPFSSMIYLSIIIILNYQSVATAATTNRTTKSQLQPLQQPHLQ